jgi:hypothetical protein
MNIIKQTWSETHPSVKTAVTIIGIGFGAWAIYKIIKGGANILDSWTSRKEGNQALEDLFILASQGIVPTLSDGEIEAMVNAIKSEFNDIYADDDIIMNQLYKVQNKADWSKLKYRWGTQDIGSGMQTLTEAISDRFYDDNKATLNQIFISKGIGAIV